MKPVEHQESDAHNNKKACDDFQASQFKPSTCAVCFCEKNQHAQKGKFQQYGRVLERCKFFCCVYFKLKNQRNI